MNCGNYWAEEDRWIGRVRHRGKTQSETQKGKSKDPARWCPTNPPTWVMKLSCITKKPVCFRSSQLCPKWISERLRESEEERTVTAVHSAFWALVIVHCSKRNGWEHTGVAQLVISFGGALIVNMFGWNMGQNSCTPKMQFIVIKTHVQYWQFPGQFCWVETRCLIPNETMLKNNWFYCCPFHFQFFPFKHIKHAIGSIIIFVLIVSNQYKTNIYFWNIFLIPMY